METLSKSNIFLPTREISETYKLINYLRTNPKAYLTTYIIPNASTYSFSSLKLLSSLLQNKDSLPILKDDSSLHKVAKDYLQYLVLTDKTIRTNPRYSLENRLRSLGLQSSQYNEIIIKYISPQSTVTKILLNENFREFLFNPNMDMMSMAMDILPTNEYCIMLNIAGLGSSTLTKSTNNFPLTCFTPEKNIRRRNPISLSSSIIHSNKTHNVCKSLNLFTSKKNSNNKTKKNISNLENNMLDNKKQRIVNKLLKEDEEIYVREQRNDKPICLKKNFININKIYPRKIGINIKKMKEVKHVNGYTMYEIVNEYKKGENRNKWLKDFNRDLSGDKYSENKNINHRHTFTPYY